MFKPFRLLAAIVLGVTGLMSVMTSPVAAESGVLGSPDYGFLVGVPDGATLGEFTSLQASIPDISELDCSGAQVRFFIQLEDGSIIYVPLSTGGLGDDCAYADGRNLLTLTDPIFSDGGGYYTFDGILALLGDQPVTQIALISETGFAEASASATWSTVLPEPEPTTGTLEIVKWFCDVPTVETDGIIGDDCVHGDATFTIYMYGDGTNEYVQVNTGEVGNVVVELPAADYQVVEESTQTFIDVTIVAGENKILSFENPIGAEPAPAPTAPAPAPAPTQPAADTGKKADTATKDTTVTVAKLPSTGAGVDEGASALAMAAVAASAIAGAGALLVNRER